MANETYEKILELKKITAKSKDLVWLYLKMAECQFRLESFEKSSFSRSETLHRNPRNTLEKAEARSYLTDNYYELGRYREAVDEGETNFTAGQTIPQ